MHSIVELLLFKLYVIVFLKKDGLMDTKRFFAFAISLLIIGIVLISGSNLAQAQTVTVYEESSPNIAYTGSWATWAQGQGGSQYSGGFAKANGQYLGGGSATLSFNGTGVAWFSNATGIPYSGTGVAKVYLDGSLVATVDLRTFTWTGPSQAVYTATGLTNTTHTLKVENKQFSSGYYTWYQWILIDKFEVTAPPPLATTIAELKTILTDCENCIGNYGTYQELFTHLTDAEKFLADGDLGKAIETLTKFIDKVKEFGAQPAPVPITTAATTAGGPNLICAECGEKLIANGENLVNYLEETFAMAAGLTVAKDIRITDKKISVTLAAVVGDKGNLKEFLKEEELLEKVANEINKTANESGGTVTEDVYISGANAIVSYALPDPQNQNKYDTNKMTPPSIQDFALNLENGSTKTLSENGIKSGGADTPGDPLEGLTYLQQKYSYSGTKIFAVIKVKVMFERTIKDETGEIIDTKKGSIESGEVIREISS